MVVAAWCHPNGNAHPTDVAGHTRLSVMQRETNETQIRIGDLDSTITGRHRHMLSGTLPDAQRFGGVLALDVVGTSDILETERVEVIASRLELQEPVCAVGTSASVGGSAFRMQEFLDVCVSWFVAVARVSAHRN